MSKQQLSDEQKQDLANAISQLSPEEQEQIAAAGCIPNDKVCQRLQQRIRNGELRVIIGYGAPPVQFFNQIESPQVIALKKQKDERFKSQDDLLKKPEGSD